MVENIWLGLKNKSNNFKWIDGSTLEFANWANRSPSREPNHDCVLMVADSHPKGKWVDEPCMICPTIIIFSYDFYRAISFGLISLLLILLYCYYSAALIHYCLMYFLVICHYWKLRMNSVNKNLNYLIEKFMISNESIDNFLKDHNDLCNAINDYNTFWKRIYKYCLNGIIPINLIFLCQVFFGKLPL
jgi:hypothetical protein